MRDNPVFFVIDLTEIFDKYIKEFSVLLEQGIQTREIINDLVLDSRRYIQLLMSGNNPAVTRDSLVRYIVNNTGATTLPYRAAIARLNQFNIDGMMADTLGFLMETLFKPIESVLKEKKETHFKIGVPRYSSDYIIVIPVWFGQEVLIMDRAISI